MGDVVVRVAHRLEPQDGGALRVTYRAEIEGPDTVVAELGPQITSDFPATMAALVARAAERDA